MKKRAIKKLTLSRETLYTLTARQIGLAVGAYPTVVSACKMAGSCVGETCTNDPDTCAPSWASNCYTHTC